MLNHCILTAVLVAAAAGFTPALLSTVATTATTTTTDNPFAEPATDLIQTKDVVSRVAVAGATGRTGRFVVQELLDRGVQQVVAVVRNEQKAQELYPDPPANLEIVTCDLAKSEEIQQVMKGCDSAIWAATGFSDAPPANLADRVKKLFGIAFASKQSIDLVGLPALTKCLQNDQSGLPKIVMLSSSGVTRPTWSDDKKERFNGAADIPIVRLNPFNILDRKRESEEQLRTLGVNYCIVRPAGLNDDWPSGSRPMLSQGDVAVGRINRKDVATILVDALSSPEATGKTFEAVALAGYPSPRSLGPALSRLKRDTELETLPDDVLFATYSAMQQLLPGERQDSAALAMGQTYEQLDQGVTGRLGERGAEDAEAAAPKPT